MWRRFLQNNPSLKVRRRTLRVNSTQAESILWARLRDSQLGYKFRRQYSFGNYIMDFYCPQKHLGIEIDGQIHKQQMQMDKYRTKSLEQYDVTIIRFSNGEVINNINKVLATIKTFLD